MFWLPLLMCSLVVAHSTKKCQQCNSTYSLWGRYLKAHVISSENVKNIGMCYVSCSKNQRCKSINFHFGDLVCQLNDADRHTHPWEYVLKEHHAYSDYPVKVCVRDFTNFIPVAIVVLRCNTSQCGFFNDILCNSGSDEKSFGHCFELN